MKHTWLELWSAIKSSSLLQIYLDFGDVLIVLFPILGLVWDKLHS